MDPRICEIDVAGIRLTVLSHTNDANWYLQRKTFEEKASSLYTLIRQAGFRSFVDVGANYGFISMLMRRAAPDVRILSIEADERLAELIGANFALNGLDAPTVVHAIAANVDHVEGLFSLNPKSTLDNRVSMAPWEKRPVRMATVPALLSEHDVSGPTFFKIDTQGFEWHILQGMQALLRSRTDWMIKMEFAPDWLRSQGTEPLALLDHLCANYAVAEFPERITFNTVSLDELFRPALRREQAPAFLDYVSSLNKNGLGWVDLLVQPARGRSVPPH
jgi:FkbM family methyltransferase